MLLTSEHVKQNQRKFDELEQQAKVTLPNVNQRTLPQGVRKQQKNDRSAIGPIVFSYEDFQSSGRFCFCI